MTSIRERIVAKLIENAAVTGVPVKRTRTNPLSKSTELGVCCYCEAERNGEQMGNRTTRELTVKFAIFVRGNEPDRLADTTVSTLVKGILADMRVGGLAVQVQELSTEWDFDSDVSEDFGTATVTFQVTYNTNRADQTVQA